MPDHIRTGSDHPLTLDEANAEIARLQAQLAARDGGKATRDPIAVVGMGCRYPGGVRTPDAFWDLLSSGRDILREIPGERWDVDAHYDPEVTVPGKIYVRHGYYLGDIDQFDPQFFGLSPREAESLDPQQRMVMEVSWETLEHAGIAPSTLRGGKTGVFVGQYWDDYSAQRIYATNNRDIDRYAQLSTLRGLTAGRICHILDSHGPAIQLDTACSSSSLAVHLACQSLRSGESDLALAGGVSLVLAPEHLIGICQMTALSPDGRCKTFDASADGFGQGEGCGIIALKRLSDAQADGDNVLAVIQGTAVNHDGQARTVTTPSGPAQRAMLQEALEDAGLSPDQIDYVETHGTGTPLGDPIEVSAIARVLCEGRTKPLYLGSVKTNVGHLDSAAGIVGVMKVVLALQHETIPPHLNYSEPNRHIPWGDWPLKVPRQNTPWQGEGRFAGISAFGMSGTNVHLIVGEAPQQTRAQTPPATHAQLLTLSAQAPGALQDLAGRYAAQLYTDAPIDLAHLCFSAATGRSHLGQRAAFVAEDPDSLKQALAAFAKGETPPGTATGTIARRAPKLAFLFTGQGAQQVGMGKALYEAQPVFRTWLNRCAALLVPHMDRPLLDVLWHGDDLHQTAYTQPALFAVEYALAKVYEAWGILPDLLLGHSIGEYAAACIAGVFPLEDALRLVAARGRLMQSLPAGGQMVSVAADEETVRAAIGAELSVSIAAVNAPRSIVVSGDGAGVGRVVDRLTQQDIKTTALKVSHAFHSPMMDPILEEFRAVAASVDFKAPHKTLISNVTGKPWDDTQLSADYWVDHLRGAVRFADGLAYAQSKKFMTFVEIGPKPTLLGLGRANVAPEYGTWVPGLRPNAGWETLLESVAALYVCGTPVDWPQFYAHTNAPRMQLPNYPWRYQRCWTDVVSTGGDGQRLHPLVHRRIDNASSNIIFESTLSANAPAYLDDHRVFGSVVFPASAFFEMAMVVARMIFGQDEVALTNVTIARALLLSDAPITVQMIAAPQGDRFDFEMCSRAPEGADVTWVQHTTGTLERRLPSPAASINIDETLARYTQPVDIAELSARFEARGLEYFPRFRAIEAIFKPDDVARDGTGSAFARIALPAEANLPGDSYRLHPVITDAGFRIAEAIFANEDTEKIHLPFGLSGFSCDHATSGTVWVKATARQQDDTRVVDLELFDDTGARVATVEQLTLRSVPVFSLKRAMTTPVATGDVLDKWLYQFEWEAGDASSDGHDQPGNWLILQDASGYAANLAAALLAKGHQAHVVKNLSDFHTNPASADTVAFTGVLHLWAMDATEHDPHGAFLGSLEGIQSLAQAGFAGNHWFVTRGAQAVDPGDNISPWQSQFWGFARTLQAEQPEQLGGAIDLDPSLPIGDPKTLDLLIDEINATGPDTEIAFRKGIRKVARLVRPIPVAQDAETRLTLAEDASYLVTGGVGALGLLVAQYLTTCGAKHLILTGRSGVSTQDQRVALHAMEEAGVRVDVVAADISNADDVARVLAAAPNLRGIVHAAGVLDDGMLMQQTAARFAKVAGPKVQGAWQLHEQTAGHRLDFFVMFSSVAAVMGSPGQSNYASANAFMDGLAHLRASQGLPATAINWGPWADVGMAASDVILQRLMTDGWHPMSAHQGCDFIGHLLTARTLPQAAVLPVDWAQFAARIPGAASWSTLKHLIPSGGASPLTANSAEVAAARVKDAPEGARVDAICAYLLERIAQTLRVPAADLDEFAQLNALGVDSLTAVELRLWVQGDLNAELAVEQLFTTPSIRDLAVSVGQLLGGTSVPPQGEARAQHARWLICPQPRRDAPTRMICFSYAGGGASAFKDWAATLPGTIELLNVQLPGREERLGEPLLRNMDALVDVLTQEIAAATDRPFAFFGHSMGAIVAYEVACRLRATGATLPDHLFVSARAAPHFEDKSAPLRFLDNDQFIERLHDSFGAVPDAIRNNPELQALFLPILRADVEMLETHEDAAADPLPCPITAIGGTDDPAISAQMLAGWQTRTSAEFTQHALPGDHFFINTARNRVVDLIVDQMASARTGIKGESR